MFASLDSITSPRRTGLREAGPQKLMSTQAQACCLPSESWQWFEGAPGASKGQQCQEIKLSSLDTQPAQSAASLPRAATRGRQASGFLPRLLGDWAVPSLSLF